MRPASTRRRPGRPTSARARLTPQTSSATGASLRTAADTFTRADGAIGTSSSGHVWEQFGTTGWTVASNTADPPSGGFAIATLPLGAADVDLTVTLNPNFQSPDWGPVVKLADVDNLIWLDIVFETDHWLCRPFQRVGGSFTGNALADVVDPIVTLGADKVTPFTARIRSVGQTGQVWINGASQCTWSALIDTGILTATKHGLAANDAPATATFDSLTMTEV